MKVKFNQVVEVDAVDSRTEGKYEYLVALRCGGLMEDPEIYYKNYQIIRADSMEEAKEKYDKINECSYFYGQVITQIS